jgi:hypothetical protein
MDKKKELEVKKHILLINILIKLKLKLGNDSNEIR